MQSVGSYLREQRLARGLSLEEVARITRVGQDYLSAIERDAFTELPAPVFTKGFIRAYCQALSQPPDEALSRYRAVLAESAPPPAPAPPPLSIRRRVLGPALAGLGLLIALGLALFLLNNAGKSASLPARPVAGEPPAAGPSRLQALPVRRSDEPVLSRLIARTSELTWIQVEMDGGRVVEELLPAGATREWTSKTRFIVTVGNAGGITFELNGRPVPPLGARGAVIRRLSLPLDLPSSPDRPSPPRSSAQP